MSEEARYLLMRGVAAAKAGEVPEARRYLERAATVDPNREQQIEIWYWLVEISSDPVEQRQLLEEILSNDPFEPRARRKLAILDGKLNPADIVDPDQVVATAPPPSADPQRFICPNCGGRLTYSPDGKSLVCESCQTRERRSTAVAEPVSTVKDQDFIVAMATAQGHLRPEATRVLSCQACGAAFILPASAISLTCPYCNSVYVVADAQTRELIVPGSVIPFCRSAADAILAMREWAAAKHYAFNETPGAVRGVYLPAWCFEVAGQVPWNCHRYEDKKWVPIAGLELILLRERLFAATPKMQAIFPDGIPDYDLGEAKAFEPGYLADWPAETYQIPMGQASLEAREEAVKLAWQKVKSTASGQVKDLRVDSTSLLVTSFRLVLFPVWMGSVKDSQENIPVLINGQTGQMLYPRSNKGIRGWLERLLS